MYAKCLCRFFVSILMSVIRPLVCSTSPSFHDVDNCVYQLAYCGAIILFSKSYNFTYNFPAETDVWRLLHLGTNLSYIDADLQPQGQFYNEDGVMVYLVWCSNPYFVAPPILKTNPWVCFNNLTKLIWMSLQKIFLKGL